MIVVKGKVMPFWFGSGLKFMVLLSGMDCSVGSFSSITVVCMMDGNGLVCLIHRVQCSASWLAQLNLYLAVVAT